MKFVSKVLTAGYNFIRFLPSEGKNAKKLLGVYSSFQLHVSKKSKIMIGNGFRARHRVEINVREQGSLEIGDHVFMNNGCIITVMESVKIGHDTIFGPNVIIYDHDHRITSKGLCDNEYKIAPIEIGANCWIGAGTTILRGTKIGNGCVIGAGCVLKGNYEAGSIVIQTRNERIKKIGDSIWI